VARHDNLVGSEPIVHHDNLVEVGHVVGARMEATVELVVG